MSRHWKNKKRWRLLKWLFSFRILSILLTFGMGMSIALLVWLSRDLPSTTRLQVITHNLKTQVLDRDGKVYGSFGTENRVAVSLDEVPHHLIDAVLSVEDKRFYRHWGVDLVRWPKILIRDIAILLKSPNAPLHGGSTLTMQLARDLFLTKEQTLTRKLKELILTLKIERTYSKDEILTMYINQIYFGAGAWGVESTARSVFGVSASDLRIEESALIAGMAKNPWAYNPLRFPERASRRRDLALNLMARNRVISEWECDSLKTIPLSLVGRMGARARTGSYFLENVRKHLIDRYGYDRLYREGLVVHTSIDSTLQAQAETRMEDHLAYLEKSMKYEDTYETVSAMLDTAATISASRQYLQGAVVLLDAEDGAIRAMIGGRDFRHSEYNRAVQSSRQPGSSFKPFVYLAALENGLAPSDQILDAPLVVKQRGQEPWKPRNHSGKFKGEVTLRHALDKSINIPAVRLIQRLGPSTVIDYARRLGIDSPLPNVLSLALGAADVPLIEITGAYGTLARGGILSEPYAILRVVDRWGHVLEEHQAERREVLDSKTSYLMTNMLQSVITQGTGVRARRMGLTRPAAGKTGTTDNNFDAWFVGYTADYVCGVWVGFDERKDMGRWMEGAHAALPIWTGVMLAAHDSLEVRDFEIPEGVGKLAVCKESSLLPTRYCPETMQEVFIEGREPNRPCDRHSLSSSQWRGSGSEFRDMDRQSMEEDEFNSP